MTTYTVNGLQPITGTSAADDTLNLTQNFSSPNIVTGIEIVQVNVTTGLNVNWFDTTIPATGIQLLGNDGNDTLGGSNAADTITGNLGADSIHGFNGNDVINGGDGADILRGGKGNDSIDGGTGNDYLVGGKGDDTLTSGAGTDSVLAGPGSDTIDITASDTATLYFNASNGTDSVTGFTHGTDKITLVSYDDNGKIDFTVDQLNAKILATADLQTAITAALATQTASGNDRTLTLLSGTSVTFSGVGTDLTAGDFNGYVAKDKAVPVSAAGTTDASSDNVTFTVASGSYTYNIPGFGAGDKLVFPSGNAPSLDNGDFADGVADLSWADPVSGSQLTIHLTGLTTTQDAALFFTDSFNTVFGAGTLTLS